jgi:hypothetical protein
MEQTFPGCSYLCISHLYRDCHSVGKGFISHDIFIAVANEQNFFTQLVKQRFGVFY